MQDFKKLIEALRLCQFGECGCGKCYYKELKGDWCTEDNHPEFFDCDDKLKLDAAAAIEDLEGFLAEAERDRDEYEERMRKEQERVIELQAEVGQWKAAVKWQEDGIKVLQAEVKRLQEKLCDWCAVCPKERRNPDDCELLGENPVMYGPSGAKMEVQE